MEPIEALMEEHRRIEEVLDALGGYVSRLKGEDAAEREDLRGFVEFIKGFADAAHHGKEEDILFLAMTDAGVPTEVGPVAVMLKEHGQGREFARVLAGVAEGEGPLDEAEREKVAEAGGNYAGLLRSHIQKEDGILYPMSETMIREDRWARIAAEFKTFEEAHADEHRRLRAIGEDLHRRFSPS